MNKTMVKFSQKALPNRDRDNDIIDSMGHSLTFLVMGVIEAKTDEFEGKIKKLENLFFFIQEEKEKWFKADNTDEILAEVKGKRSYIYEACKEVPFSQLLYLVDKKKLRTCNFNTKAYLQAGYCLIAFWMDSVLKEHYRFNVEKRKLVFHYLNDWIDSYQKGYLSNEGIREQLIIDLNWDVVNGKKVDGANAN